MTIEENILMIRKELVEFASECAHLDSDRVIAAVNHLSDAEILTLYVESTFDNEWLGEVVEVLAAFATN